MQAALPFRCRELSFSSSKQLIRPQGMGGMLIRKVDGDYNNVVGFPAASFIRFLEVLLDEEEDFLMD